jgi:hypothetical protein
MLYFSIIERTISNRAVWPFIGPTERIEGRKCHSSGPTIPPGSEFKIESNVLQDITNAP